MGSQLLDAAAEGNLRAVENLLNGKANVDSKDASGYTCLHMAANRGNKKAIELLLKHNANMDLKDAEGFTCLHLAVMSENPSVTQLLLEAKANPLAEKTDDCLMYARGPAASLLQAARKAAEKEALERKPGEDARKKAEEEERKRREEALRREEDARKMAERIREQQRQTELEERERREAAEREESRRRLMEDAKKSSPGFVDSFISRSLVGSSSVGSSPISPPIGYRTPIAASGYVERSPAPPPTFVSRSAPPPPSSLSSPSSAFASTVLQPPQGSRPILAVKGVQVEPGLFEDRFECRSFATKEAAREWLRS